MIFGKPEQTKPATGEAAMPSAANLPTASAALGASTAAAEPPAGPDLRRDRRRPLPAARRETCSGKRRRSATSIAQRGRDFR